MKLFRWICIFVAVIATLSLIGRSQAQNDDCGSGLRQRLTVGGRGFVTPTPPDLRLRNGAAGDQIGALALNLAFTVVEGPICANNMSWWHVQADDGQNGWIAEGANGMYFVDTLPTPASATATFEPATAADDQDSSALNPPAIQNNNLACDDLPESQFTLGDFVTLINPSADSYYGHPLIEDSLFLYNDEPSRLISTEEMWLIEGPYCFDGDYLWRVATSDLVSNLFYNNDPGSDNFSYPNPFYGSDRSVILGASPWIFETHSGSTNLQKISKVIESLTSFTPTIVHIDEPTIAIQPELQVAFGAVGGGGGGADEGWFLPCDNAVVEYYFNGCLYLYPFDIENEIEVSIFQPDGTLYSSYIDVASQISATTYESVTGTRSSQMSFSFDAVRVEIPYSLGLPLGVWTVTATDGVQEIRRIYRFGTMDQESGFPRYIASRCDGGLPLLMFGGFQPHEQVELLLIEQVGDEISNGTIGTVPFVERARWTFEIGDTGRMAAYIDYLIPNNSYFILNHPSGDWRQNLRENFVQTTDGSLNGLLVKAVHWGCANLVSPMDAQAYRISYGDLISSEFPYSSSDTEQYFMFEGRLGDVVTIEVMGTFLSQFEWGTPPPDMNLRLRDANGVILIANEDAENAGYYPTDSKIETFQLPYDGSFTIVVGGETEGLRRPGFTLTLDAQQSSTIEQELPFSQALQGSLITSSSQWIFEGVAGENVTFEASSPDFDPRLELQLESGDIIAEDDDDGDGLNARISFTLPLTGSYRLILSSWNEKVGDFTLEAERG